MSDAKELLEMICSVHPDDGRKLDQIDARAWCYYNEYFYIGRHEHFPDIFYWKDKNGNMRQTGDDEIDIPKYTRSRDALKAIRPELEHWEVGNVNRDRFYCYARNNPAHGEIQFIIHCFAKTEELAELYAIIQVIAHDRGEL